MTRCGLTEAHLFQQQQEKNADNLSTTQIHLTKKLRIFKTYKNVCFYHFVGKKYYEKMLHIFYEIKRQNCIVFWHCT